VGRKVEGVSVESNYAVIFSAEDFSGNENDVATEDQQRIKKRQARRHYECRMEEKHLRQLMDDDFGFW